MKFEIKPPVWISALYFAEGVPAAVICEVSVVIFAALGRSPENIARDVSLLGMPWMFKPLWSCIVDLRGTKRGWIVATQLSIGALFAVAAGCVGSFGWLWTVLLAAAFVSATHDIAADGFYIVALDDYRQSLYSGLRSVFYRAAMIVANGGLVYAAARWGRAHGGSPWPWALGTVAAAFIVLALFHFAALPREERGSAYGAGAFKETLKAFLKLPDLGSAVAFLLLFRFAEAQLTIMSRLFLLDPAGGGLSLEQYGVMVGTIGVGAMLAGGVCGGIFASRVGLKAALMPMALALNVPDALYTWWAFFPVSGGATRAAFIAVEQFGYGFGFTGYMLVMIYVAGRCGAFQTTIFSLLSCLMIFGLRLPGAFSGQLLAGMNRWGGISVWSSYQNFFVWVLAVTPVSFAATWHLARRLPAEYGRKA